MFALSTAWNAHQHKKAQQIIQEIKKAGFRCVELGFSLAQNTVEEICRAKDKEGIEIVSLHNFCPAPKGLDVKDALPDCFSMASLDEEERKRAVRYTKATIAMAHRLCAKAVVLHCGRVEIKDQTLALIHLYLRGLKDTDIYESLRNQIVKERKGKAKKHFHQTLKSLEELASFSRSRNIKLGIENRFYFREIPSFEEIGIILENFAHDDTVFYWHDTGHAQVYENLGFGNHLEFLKSYSHRMIGMHLHDVDEVQDHRPAANAHIDFQSIFAFTTPLTLKVLEIHPPATMEDIKKSRLYLEKQLKRRFHG